MLRSVRFLAVASAIGVAAGCGSSGSDSSTTTPTIDPAKIEPQLVQELAQSAGVSAAGVNLDCPEGEPAEQGHKFDCTLTAADGSQVIVNVTVTSAEVSGDQLNYHVHGVVPKSQFK